LTATAAANCLEEGRKDCRNLLPLPCLFWLLAANICSSCCNQPAPAKPDFNGLDQVSFHDRFGQVKSFGAPGACPRPVGSILGRGRYHWNIGAVSGFLGCQAEWPEKTVFRPGMTISIGPTKSGAFFLPLPRQRRSAPVFKPEYLSWPLLSPNHFPQLCLSSVGAANHLTTKNSVGPS